MAASAAVASATAGESRSWWKGITTNGYASLSYTYNANDPDDRQNQFRVFDFNDNEPQLDVAQIVVQHAASDRGQFGFRGPARGARRHVFVDPQDRAFANGDQAILAPLAHADHHRAALGVDVVELE